MAWINFYLGPDFHHRLFAWGIAYLLGFEILYIAIQAVRGQGSHYNVTSSFYTFLYVLMAIAAALVTFWTAYVGFLFFNQKFSNLSSNYLWGIRLGILIFVVFSFEGFLMGSRMSHTVGAVDGSDGIWFLNWSKKFGDLRVSHFLGMHALQIIPLMSFYIFRSVVSVAAFSFLYFSIALLILYLTLKGQPLVRIS